MRKVSFSINGEVFGGHYVGISGGGINNNGENYTLLLVEDEHGNLHTLYEKNVKFLDKPVCMAPVKRLDLRLMSNAIERLAPGTYTLTDLIKLAEDKNIIVEDTLYDN